MRTIHRVEAVPELPKRKRTAAYARVSSGKDSMLHSLSAQVSYFSDFIQSHNGWDFAGIYADEALTGTKADRPEFVRLMADCRAGLVDMVVTKSISRFARNTVTTLEAVRELKELGIDVWFLSDDIHSLSAEGELMLTLLSSFAQEESRSASENKLFHVRKCFKEGKPVGFTGMYGYDYKDGQNVVNEEQAVIIRQMFDWYIGGMGITAIAQRLNSQGIPSSLGGAWHPTRVGELLKNEKLTGNSMLQKYYTEDHLTKKQKRNKGEKDRYFAEGTHPAIISTEVFDEAQRLRAERAAHFKARDNSRNTYPFSGVILCENCGKHYKRKKGAGKFYWQCSTFLQEGKAVCPAKQIPEDILLTVATMKFTQIRVPKANMLVITLPDGTEIERKWQDRSRRASWTDEMRQKARERALFGHGTEGLT